MGKHDLANMAALDIYLSSLSEDEFREIEKYLSPTIHNRFPIVSWDIASQADFRNPEMLTKIEDLQLLKSLKKKYLWNFNFECLKNYKYEALVITDFNQQIIWVNSGFTTMTGYYSNQVIGKTPGILQGEKTSTIIKQQLRIKLSTGKPFSVKLINYRKNGEEYLCEVNIFPLQNRNKEITHFLALENQAA